ncbi:MAG TPA: hypothetical protein VKY89_23675 [Thermoanaerobaculia bacterium]|jgi:hypothetical protein|nr:hypothetical protein [Thermoanaerobaculia bacterium]
MAADPSSLTRSLGADGLSVEFSSLAGDITLDAGLLILLTCRSGPSGQAATAPTYVMLTTSSQRPLAVSGVAPTLAKTVSDPQAVGKLVFTPNLQPARFTAQALGNRLTLTPTTGNTCSLVDCTISAVDDTQYFDDYVRGGIRIQAGGTADFGTLGCLAVTAPTPAYPQGMVVALTCQHVVEGPSRQATNLAASTANGAITFTNTAANPAAQRPILAGTLVVVALTAITGAATTAPVIAFYATLPGDTLGRIATQVAAAVSQLNAPGVTVTPANNVVTVDGATPGCRTFGPPQAGKADLHATVTDLTIEITGAASGDDYGIFTTFEGQGTTFGVFTRPAKGQAPAAVATAIAQSLNGLLQGLSDTARGEVQVSASGAQVTVDGALAVECVVRGDCRVGQPDHEFGSTCSHCCSHRIGRVLDARTDVDVAIVQLDDKQKYKPVIQGFSAGNGLLTGTVAAAQLVPGLAVMKRGRLTGLTSGTIAPGNHGGAVTLDGAFYRRYANALQVTPSGSGPFSLPGDSGAAVFTGDGKLVGILFGAVPDATGLISLVTPIDQILAAFPALRLDVAPPAAAGQGATDVRKVPQAVKPAGASLLGPMPAPASAASPAAFLGQRLAQVEQEVAATPAGAELADLVRLHFAETARLVNSNRRVATVWHRSGGPRLVQAVLDLAQRRGQRLPEEIEGRPFAECLARIGRVLSRYASPALAADLSRHGPRLARFAGLTYEQLLAALQPGTAE